APSVGRRRLLLGGGRVPRVLHERAHGADLEGRLRGSDTGADGKGARRLRQGAAAQARLPDRPPYLRADRRTDRPQGREVMSQDGRHTYRGRAKTAPADQMAKIVRFAVLEAIFILLVLLPGLLY